MSSTYFSALIVNETPDGVIVTTPEGSVAHWTQGAERVFGYPSAEAIGRSLTELIIPPERHDEEDAVLKQVLESGFCAYESIRKKKDGAFVHVNISTKAIRNADGKIEYVLSSQKDVTHIKALRETRQLETWFQDVIDAIPDAAVLESTTGHIVLTNALAERMFGYGFGELRGKATATVLPNLVRTTFGEAPGPINAKSSGLESSGLRKDGNRFPVRIHGNDIAYEGKTLTLQVMREMAPSTQSVLRESEERFRLVVESVQDYAIFMLNTVGEISSWNIGAQRIKGYFSGEILGKHFSIFYPEPEIRAGKPQAELLAAASAGRFEDEGWRLRKDGSRFWANVVITALFDDAGELCGYCKVARDITERKLAEQALLEKNCELEKAIRAKDQFLASMSHELRTPLNAIIGFTGTLLMKLPGPLTFDQEKQLRTVQISARNLLTLINDLLDLTEVNSGKLALVIGPTACQSVIKEVADKLRPLAEKKNLAFSVNMPNEEKILHIDRRLLMQIVLHLVNNAIKFTEAGTVSVSLTQRDENDMRYFDVAVGDTGIGIAPEDVEKLFQPFRQLDAATTKRYEGSGLGLYLSRKFAGLIGGTLQYRSRQGGGSEFILTLAAALK